MEVIPTAYADDINIIVIHKAKTVTSRCKTVLGEIARCTQDWLDEQGMSISAEKSKIVRLTGTPALCDTRIQNNIITNCTCLKIPGITYSKGKLFSKHITDLLAKESSYLGILKANSKRSYKAKWRILETLILPKILFLAEIWYPHINRAQRQKLASLSLALAATLINAPPTIPRSPAHILAKLIPLTIRAEQLYRQAQISANRITIGDTSYAVEEKTRQFPLFHPASIPRPITGVKIRRQEQLSKLTKADSHTLH